MEGASVAGDVVDRGHAALEAGCDMVLVCNSPDNISRVVEGLRYQDDPASHLRLVRMHGRIDMLDQDLAENPRWLQAVEAITELHHP
jgi:beta-N-acetylhexosaminidase